MLAPLKPEARATPLQVTPQFYVFRLLARALPRGARLFEVPALRRRGVGVWLGPGRVNFIVVRPSKCRRPAAFALDASLARAAAAPAAGAGAAATEVPAATPAAPAAAAAPAAPAAEGAAHAAKKAKKRRGKRGGKHSGGHGGGAGGAKSAAAVAEAQEAAPAAEPAAAAAAETAAASVAPAAAAAPPPQSTGRVTSRVVLLNLNALDAAGARAPGGAPPEVVAHEGVAVAGGDGVDGDDGVTVVEVAPGFLAVIELAAAA